MSRSIRRQLFAALAGFTVLLCLCYTGLALVIAYVTEDMLVQRLLEREAALHFARVVSDDELQAIEQAHLAIIERAQRDGITDELLTDATSVDWGLHDLMIDTLGNELISQAYRINSLRVRLIHLERSTLSADILLPAMLEHLALITAIKTRDPNAVADALGHHIHSAHERVLGRDRRALGPTAITPPFST